MSKVLKYINSENSYDRISYESGHSDCREIIWISPRLFAQPLYVREAILEENKGRCKVEHHRTFYMALEFILAGELNFNFDARKYHGKAGSLVFFHKPRNCGFSTADGGSFSKLALIVSGVQLEFLLSSLKLDQCEHMDVSDPAEVERRFREIIALLAAKQIGTERLVNEKIYSLFLYLADEWNFRCQKAYPVELQAALEYLECNFRLPQMNSDIARSAGCSSATLVRQFRKHLNCSPNAYLSELRLNYATLLLRGSNMRIKEVAHESGYTDPLYFSTVFRRKFNQSPQEYRKKL